tara:strand:- start:286 stop:531 length:246 start_codon:yes stop_codon:yes gene_type:complete
VFFFFFFFFSFALLLLDQLKALVVVSPTRFRDFKKNDAGVGESLLGQKSRDNNTTATRLRSKERERYENNYLFFNWLSLFD